jgi:hypothetical protein
MQQNLTTSSMDVLHYRDARVRLVWRREHEYRVDEGPVGGSAAPEDPEGGEDRHASA